MKKFYVVGMAVAMAASMVFVAAPAGAAAVLTCAKPSGTVSFSPGITPTAKIQTTTFKLPIKSCHGTPGITGGTSSGKSVGKKPTNCANFSTAASQSTSVKITWSNKKTSTASLATKIVPGKPGSITASVSGKISVGQFKGKTIKTKVTVTLKGKCTPSQPIKQAILTGAAPLTIS